MTTAPQPALEAARTAGKEYCLRRSCECEGGCATEEAALDGAIAYEAARQTEAALAEARERVGGLEKAAELMVWFCNRVDRGEVRSTRTYAEFKKFLLEFKPAKAAPGQEG